MNKIILVTAITMLSTGIAHAKPFCASCHSGHKDKVGPAFTDVVGAYGSVDEVFKFLNSDDDLLPKVEAFAKKSKLMKIQLKKYRKLSDNKKAEVRTWFEEQVN